MGLNYKIKPSSPNYLILSQDVSSQLFLQGEFNFPVVIYGSNSYAGGKYTIDGGKNWADVSVGAYYPAEYTAIGSNGLGSNTNLSPNLQDCMVWSWSTSAGYGIKFLTNDGGHTWVSEAETPTASTLEYTHWNQTNGIGYVGGWASYNKKTADGGKTLTLMSVSNVINFDSADDASYIYGGRTSTKRIYRSTDNGENFTEVLVGTSDSGDHTVVKCDRTGQYVCAYYGGRSRYCYFSNDYGVNFSSALPGSLNSRMTITRDSSAIIYDAAADSSIFISNDQGANWHSVISPFGTSSVMFRNDFIHDEVYAYAQNQNKVYKLKKDRTDFELFTILDPSIGGAFEPSQYGRGFAYVGTDNQTIYFSRNGQSNWRLAYSGSNVTYLMVL